jgi:hypothetical protein
MAATKTQRSTKTKAPAKSKADSKTGTDQVVELSEEVLQSVEDGQRAAIEAVQKFVDSVDRVLPALPHDEGPSRRQEIIDSALEMSDRLVHTQYDFMRKVVDSAGKSLSAK